MGYLASQAMATQITDFVYARPRLSQSPYPGPVEPGSRYFVLEYLSWRSEQKADAICAAFVDMIRGLPGPAA